MNQNRRKGPKQGLSIEIATFSTYILAECGRCTICPIAEIFGVRPATLYRVEVMQMTLKLADGKSIMVLPETKVSVEPVAMIGIDDGADLGDIIHHGHEIAQRFGLLDRMPGDEFDDPRFDGLSLAEHLGRTPWTLGGGHPLDGFPWHAAGRDPFRHHA